MEDPGAEFVQQIDDDTLEALVETLYVAAFADGRFSDEERTRFSASVAYLTRGRLASPAAEQLLQRVAERHGDGARTARLAAIRERLATAELRRIALVLAADMAAADGVLHDAERAVLRELGDALEVDPNEVRELLDVPPR